MVKMRAILNDKKIKEIEGTPEEFRKMLGFDLQQNSESSESKSILSFAPLVPQKRKSKAKKIPIGYKEVYTSLGNPDNPEKSMKYVFYRRDGDRSFICQTYTSDGNPWQTLYFGSTEDPHSRIGEVVNFLLELGENHLLTRAGLFSGSKRYKTFSKNGAPRRVAIEILIQEGYIKKVDDEENGQILFRTVKREGHR